jgi:hypothetical protein
MAELTESRKSALEKLLSIASHLHDGGLADLLQHAGKLYYSQGSGQRSFTGPADLPPLGVQRRRELLSHTSTGRKILAEEDAAAKKGGSQWH